MHLLTKLFSLLICKIPRRPEKYFEGWWCIQCWVWWVVLQPGGWWHGDTYPGQDLGVVYRSILNVVTAEQGGIQGRKWAKDRIRDDPGSICFTPCPLHLSSEYPKASGTALMGLKKKRLGWKRTSYLMFRVSGQFPWSLPDTCLSVDVCYCHIRVPETYLSPN